MRKSQGRSGISVVIPVRNRSLVIGRALDSVYAQTLLPDEIIVVDDASDDAGATIATALSHARPSIPLHIIELPKRQGASSARNMGIITSKGTWVALLDSDDAFAATKLARQIAVTDKATAAVFTDTQFNRPNSTTYKYYDTIPNVDELIYRNVLGGCSTALIRRSALDAVGMFDVNLCSCQDWDLWIKLRNIGKIRVIFDPLTLVFFDGAERISHDIDNVLSGHHAIFNRINLTIKNLDELSKLRNYQDFYLAQTKLYWTGKIEGVFTSALRQFIFPNKQGGRSSALSLIVKVVIAKLSNTPTRYRI